MLEAPRPTCFVASKDLALVQLLLASTLVPREPAPTMRFVKSKKTLDAALSVLLSSVARNRPLQEKSVEPTVVLPIRFAAMLPVASALHQTKPASRLPALRTNQSYYKPYYILPYLASNRCT